MTATLNGTDAHGVSGFEDEIDATTVRSVRERLRTAFPAPYDLIQVVVTPNEATIEEACVVRTIAEVDGCPVLHRARRCSIGTNGLLHVRRAV